MRAITFSLFGILLLFGSNSLASAQSIYYGAHGGLNLAHDADATDGVVTEEVAYDLGFAFGGFVGYDLGNGLRLEGEVTYRVNDFDTLGGISFGGDVSSLALMANGFYDFDSGSPFVPYVGAGAGVANVSANDINFLGIQVVDDDATVFAYQLGVGVGYEVSPTLTLTADYRYFATADVDLNDTGGFPFEFEYANSTFLIGARASF